MLDELVENTALRPFMDDDKQFVLNSWLKQLIGAPQFAGCPARLYYPHAEQLFKHLLSCKQCIVLCAKDYQLQIMGYIVWDAHINPNINTIYFAYVKKPYRRLGALRWMIGQLLGRQDPIQYTFQTRVSQEVAKKFNAIYNPFEVMR